MPCEVNETKAATGFAGAIPRLMDSLKETCLFMDHLDAHHGTIQEQVILLS